MGRVRPFASVLAAFAALAVGSAPASGQCRLCATPTTIAADEPGAGAIALEVQTSIDFGRLVVAAAGEGSAVLRPDGSASATGSIADALTRAIVGSAVVQGQPGKAVRIQLPARIVLTSSSGSQIIFEDVLSDLPSLPRLDAGGRLAFRFGGRLRVTGDAEGQYRGDLPILVEYP
jgi:hypothetical protein